MSGGGGRFHTFYQYFFFFFFFKIFMKMENLVARGVRANPRTPSESATAMGTQYTYFAGACTSLGGVGIFFVISCVCTVCFQFIPCPRMSARA